VLAGSGVRVTLGEGGRHECNVGFGLMLEDERLDPEDLPAGEGTGDRTVRGANLASWRDGVELRNVTYWQPRMSDPGDYRLLDDVGLGVAITRRVGLDVRVELRYDSRPPSTIERRDVAFATALRIGFP